MVDLERAMGPHAGLVFAGHSMGGITSSYQVEIPADYVQ